jgi:RNA polymerase sigma factor (sigma-70 family)
MKIRPENITTYGELRDALPQTGNRKVPKIRQLKKDAKLILQRRTDSGTIRIYNNGFFTYEESGRATVYGVDRCERPETYAYSGKKEEAPGEVDFSGYPWELILECAGAARLSHNACQREEYLSELSLDAPASRNNIAFSVRPEHEIRDEEEKETARREAMLEIMRKGLKTLTFRQRKILKLRYGKGLGFEKIGKMMGITRETAFINCERALKRVQTNMGETSFYRRLREYRLQHPKKK